MRYDFRAYSFCAVTTALGKSWLRGYNIILMKMSYEDFEKQYLEQVNFRCMHIVDSRETAKKLCKELYEIFKNRKLLDSGNVDYVLNLLCKDKYAQKSVSPMRQVAELIYGENQACQYDNWISFEEFIRKLSLILHKLPLVERICTLLRILDCDNVAIAKFLNETLVLDSMLSHTKEKLSDIEKNLTIFRRHVVLRAISLKGLVGKWLPKVMEENSDAGTELRAWQDIRYLLSQSVDNRFARGKNPYDKYGRLRDYWNSGKKHIINQIKLKDIGVKVKDIYGIHE